MKEGITVAPQELPDESQGPPNDEVPPAEELPAAREAGPLAGVVAALSLVGIVGLAATTASAPAAAAPEESPSRPGAMEPPKIPHDRSPQRLSPQAKPLLDRSGKKRIGKASFYARMFAGRKMADGTPMRPAGNNAASRTLPLGTTAKVTNLETGKAAVVTIRDRGPYVAGRIVDLSPATARQIGLDAHAGITKVEVAPITVPMENGELKIGDGVLEANNSHLATNIRNP